MNPGIPQGVKNSQDKPIDKEGRGIFSYSLSRKTKAKIPLQGTQLLIAIFTQYFWKITEVVCKWNAFLKTKCFQSLVVCLQMVCCPSS